MEINVVCHAWRSGCGGGGQARWLCGPLEGSSAHAHTRFAILCVCQVELERLEKEAAQRAARLAEESLSVEKRLVEAMRWVQIPASTYNTNVTRRQPAELKQPAEKRLVDAIMAAEVGRLLAIASKVSEAWKPLGGRNSFVVGCGLWVVGCGLWGMWWRCPMEGENAEAHGAGLGH